MRKPKAIVLDSWAIMAYLEDEPAAETVANLIADAHDDGTPIHMTVVNAGEVWYIVARRSSISDADRVIRLLHDIGIKMIDADWALTQLAARHKVSGRISFADCFAAALTKQMRAILVTGDLEFKQFENDINIMWLP